MFSFFAPRANRLPVAFLEHFRTSLYPWTLVATGGQGRVPVATFLPQTHGAASEWMIKAQKQKRNVMALMAETHGAVTGVMLVRGHLRGSRHFGVKLPMAKAEMLEAFKPEPFLRLHAGNRLYVAWRLINEVPIEAVEAVASTVAAKLGGVSIGHLVPVAGTMHEGARVELFHLYKDRLNVLTDFHGLEHQVALPEPSFIKASEVKAKPLPWLWHGAVLRGALSLLAGPGGVGKSTIAASIAATVTTGGAFPDGTQAEVGSVIFCEGEDDPESVTLPRLQAAGADLSRLIIGPMCDLSQDIDRLEKAVKALGAPPALLVLSPVRSFFGKETYLDTEVRERLGPVLRWAERHTVAILGITHPPRGKQDFAGAGAWKNAARAGFFVEKDRRRPMRRILSPLKANSGRDDWQLAYVIESVKLPSGIETSRVIWQGKNATEVHRGDLRPVSEPAKPKQRIARQPKPDMTNVVRMPARTTDAATWLRAALASGPRDATDLKAEAKNAGIPERTLYRAVKHIDVKISGGGFARPRIWSL